MTKKEIDKKEKDLKKQEDSILTKNILWTMSLDIAGKYADLLKEYYDLKKDYDKLIDSINRWLLCLNIV